MATVKLAEALLRRKELTDRLARIQGLRAADVYEVKARRVNVTESLDDITAHVPKLRYAEVDAEYNYYARQLRLCDAAIQQANWITEIEVGDCMVDRPVPEPEESAA